MKFTYESRLEEILYPVLQDDALDFIIGSLPSAKSIRSSLPRFTLVGATTKAGRLSAPLSKYCFGVHARKFTIFDRAAC